jgi:hypothetical protein
LHEGEKNKSKNWKKNGGKRLKSKKLQGLPLHWLFTNVSITTKTSSWSPNRDELPKPTAHLT